jgi:hypothetical protein
MIYPEPPLPERPAMSHGLSPHITVSQPSKPTNSVTLSNDEKRKKKPRKRKKEGGKKEESPWVALGTTFYTSSS